MVTWYYITVQMIVQSYIGTYHEFVTWCFWTGWQEHVHSINCISLNREKGYLLPTWVRKIHVTCQCFDWMLQSVSHLMTTGVFSRNVGKLFLKLKLVTDNLSIYAAANWEATESASSYQSRPTKYIELPTAQLGRMSCQFRPHQLCFIGWLKIGTTHWTRCAKANTRPH